MEEHADMHLGALGKNTIRLKVLGMKYIPVSGGADRGIYTFRCWGRIEVQCTWDDRGEVYAPEGAGQIDQERLLDHDVSMGLMNSLSAISECCWVSCKHLYSWFRIVNILISFRPIKLWVVTIILYPDNCKTQNESAQEAWSKILHFVQL